MKTYQKLKTELLQDRAIRKAYQELEPEFALMKLIIQKRIEKGLTQKELARRIGTKQSAVSRLESGTSNPTFSFLQKVAQALGTTIKVSMINPKELR